MFTILVPGSLGRLIAQFPFPWLEPPIGPVDTTIFQCSPSCRPWAPSIQALHALRPKAYRWGLFLVVSPVGDYLHCRALDLQGACQLTPETQIKVSALVCLDGVVAEYHRRKSADAASLQSGRVQSAALQPILDPVADRYFMVIVPGMPPREVEPVTVKSDLTS